MVRGTDTSSSPLTLYLNLGLPNRSERRPKKLRMFVAHMYIILGILGTFCVYDAHYQLPLK